VKILIDAQMPPALAGWLQEQGHDAQAVRDVGLREADDSAIWAYALQTGAVIVTKDEDFAARAQQVNSGPVIVWASETCLLTSAVAAQQVHSGPVIVWLRVGNCSNAALRAWLEPRLPGIMQVVAQGSRLVEVI
jgi:predicted nuclease of predicted toxin-antitoxin system